MGSVFTPCNGGVHRVALNCGSSGGGDVFRITVNGAGIGVPVTGFALELQGNYQFLHTVNEFIYLYVFGDRIGELVLTGMGFFGDVCPGTLGAGVCELLDFYKENRVAKRPDPVSVSMGDCGTFLAFLTGMRIEIAKPETSVAQWVLRFNVLMPDE